MPKAYVTKVGPARTKATRVAADVPGIVRKAVAAAVQEALVAGQTRGVGRKSAAGHTPVDPIVSVVAANASQLKRDEPDPADVLALAQRTAARRNEAPGVKDMIQAARSLREQRGR